MKQQQIGRKEIIMIIVTIMLMITLGVKSTFFDEVKNLSPAEQQFKDFVDYSVARDHDGAMEKAPLMVYRVYQIEIADKGQKAVLQYKDPETRKKVKIVQDDTYKAKVRGYVLGIFPISHIEVTSEIQK